MSTRNEKAHVALGALKALSGTEAGGREKQAATFWSARTMPGGALIQNGNKQICSGIKERIKLFLFY
jgi:hypothetical protein